MNYQLKPNSRLLKRKLRITQSPTSTAGSESSPAGAIVPARSPLLEMNRQQLASLEAVFEAMPELEFDQTAYFGAEAGHN